MSSTRIILAEQGDQSGLVRTYTIADSIFYGAQDTVALDYNCRKAYGSASFTGDSYIVWLYYQPQDADGIFIAEPMIIGGYVTTWNLPIYGKFRINALRLGVRFTDVKAALEKRINLAKDLINSGGSGDNSRFGNIPYLKRIEKILKNRIKLVKKQVDNDVTNCILTTAYHKINYRKKIIVDYVVFNQGFFDTYYPSSAFPIGSPLNYENSPWIDRDYFIPQFFKFKKEPVIETNDGINKILPAHKWSLSPIEYTSDNWKIILKIIFRRTSSFKKKSNPTEERPAPKPVEVLPPKEASEKAIEAIKSGGQNIDNDSIKEGQSVAEGIDRRSSAVEGSGKKGNGDKYNSYGDSIRGEIVNTLIKESDKIGNKIDKVDVFGKDFEKTMDEAKDLIDDMADLEATGELSGEEYEQSKEKLLEKISSKYAARVEEMGNAYSNIDINSPDLEGAEEEIVDDWYKSQIAGSSGDTNQGTLKKFGDKRKERMEHLLKIWMLTDRTNQEFFEIPDSIYEDYASMGRYGVEEDAHKNIINDLKDKIIIEIRAEINSPEPNKQLLDRLFNLTKKLKLDHLLPNNIRSYFGEKKSGNENLEIVGQGTADLTSSGNIQKIGSGF